MPIRLRGSASFCLATFLLLAPFAAEARQDGRPIALVDNKGAEATSELPKSLWRSARTGDWSKFGTTLNELSGVHANEDVAAAARQLRDHLSQREVDRAKRTTEVREQFDKALAGEQTDITMGKALRAATELQLLAIDKEAVVKEGRITALIESADKAAHAAEARGDILTSYELFSLLGTLLEESGKYKGDVKRLSQRLEMIRLYVPETLWKMRDARQRAAGEEPLPPYNRFGDDYQTKLGAIDQNMLEAALARTQPHIEQQPINVVLASGLEAVKTMATTKDLQEAFPKLADEQLRTQFLEAVDAELTRLEGLKHRMDMGQVDSVIDRVRKANEATVQIPNYALFHECGNGAMGKLDEFSAIIWPDEMRRFMKMTQSSFVGVGIQIEYDELSNVRVVTPLEGTPAQRAGIHPGDVLKKVDGREVFGLSLDQAVDVITGPKGTSVVLTMERKVEGAKPDEKGVAPTETKEFKLTRSIINVATVKGWKRTGIKENDWDWFIDKDAGIGYVRLTQFANQTAREFDDAVRSMRATGLNALVLDLRFNPGGLLDQALAITRRFVNATGGYVLLTQGPGGVIDQTESSQPSRAVLSGIPVIILVNEGSASASEIVSGAVQSYQKGGPLEGGLDVLVVGARSFGKGSVQNVMELPSGAQMKVTTHYYMLPDKRIIHRRPAATEWGVEPNLKVEMLPKQTVDAVTIRRNADVIALDESGKAKADFLKEGNPDDLLSKGLDLQLETAVVLLKTKLAGAAAPRTETVQK